METNYGILSLIPALLAIILAFKTKNVVLSLIISLFTGTLIISGGNPWAALQSLFSDYLFVDITSGSSAQTIIMMSIVGGFVALIDKSGGAKALARSVAKSINTRVKAQISCWIGGLAIFFSDSGNSLILGPIFRPIFDRLKVSREKLSYILDSTSAPVCILVPITGWGVYIMSIIAQEYETLGIVESDATVFMKALPFQFYAITALLIIPFIALSGKEFGPMAKAEKRIVYENKLFNDGLTEEISEKESDPLIGKEVKTRIIAIPLAVLFIVIFAMFISWGFPTQNIPGSKIRVALSSGYLLASIAAMILIIKDKVMTFNECFDTFMKGIQKMSYILVIIVIAWGVGSVCSNLGTSSFLVESTKGILSPKLVPAFIFVIGMLISFATGTSWGTFAILLPIGINMAYSFDVSMYVTIAAVLSGGLFGDHCSPISDTTILSSTSANCNHIEHVRTQLPYALIAAIGSFIGYLVAGFMGGVWVVTLPIAIIATVILYFIASKLWGESIPKHIEGDVANKID